MRWQLCVMRDFQKLKEIRSLPTSKRVTQYASLLAFTHFALQQWGWQCHEQVNSKSLLLSSYWLSWAASSHPFLSSLNLRELVSLQFSGIQSRGSFHTRWRYPIFDSLSELYHEAVRTYGNRKSQTWMKPWVYSVIQWSTQLHTLRSQHPFLNSFWVINSTRASLCCFFLAGSNKDQLVAWEHGILKQVTACH